MGYNSLVEAQEEISRLRAALEQYADQSNWKPEKDRLYGVSSSTGWQVFVGENTSNPWVIAQEALNG